MCHFCILIYSVSVSVSVSVQLPSWVGTQSGHGASEAPSQSNQIYVHLRLCANTSSQSPPTYSFGVHLVFAVSRTIPFEYYLLVCRDV